MTRVGRLVLGWRIVRLLCFLFVCRGVLGVAGIRFLGVLVRGLRWWRIFCGGTGLCLGVAGRWT